VICLRIVRPHGNSPLQRFAGLLPAFLLAISIAEIFERDPVIGIPLKSLLKVADGLRGMPIARGEKAKVVPGVGQRVGIARAEFHLALEAFPRLLALILFQVNAPQPVVALSAGWIVAKSQPE